MGGRGLQTPGDQPAPVPQSRIFAEEDIQRYLRDARGAQSEADVLRSITAPTAATKQGPQKALASVWGPLSAEKKTIVKGFTDYLSELQTTGEAGRKYGIDYGKFVQATEDQPGRAATIIGQVAPRQYKTAVAIDPYNTALGGVE